MHLEKVFPVIENGWVVSETEIEFPKLRPSHVSQPVKTLHDCQPDPQSIAYSYKNT